MFSRWKLQNRKEEKLRYIGYDQLVNLRYMIIYAVEVLYCSAVVALWKNQGNRLSNLEVHLEASKHFRLLLCCPLVAQKRFEQTRYS